MADAMFVLRLDANAQRIAVRCYVASLLQCPGHAVERPGRGPRARRRRRGHRRRELSPAAVERVLLAEPGVEDAVVVGVPDLEWGASVVALVVADPATTDTRLRAAVADRLGAPPRPTPRAAGRRPAPPRHRQAGPARCRRPGRSYPLGVTTTTAAPGVRDWVAGARPRTLPAAVAPVLVGTGAAARPRRGQPGDERCSRWWSSLALQVGVNYANDYSDGIRGTDADRVGPLRLVGSGLAAPAR